MDYKNLIHRSFSSFFLIILLFLLINFLEIYIPFVLILIYVVILCEIFFSIYNRKNNYFLLIFYLILSFICSELYFIYYYEKHIFIYFITLIVSFDTFSYILGSLFGEKKLIPKISPNKTVLGLFFGFLLTLFVSTIFNFYYEFYNFFKALFFCILIIISSFIGDLIESFYKRISGIKNSSNIIPGHGGLFDRLDGFVMGVITLFLFSYFL